MYLKIFTVGGTIDKIYFDQQSDYEVGEPQIGELLRIANVSFDFDVEVLFKKDSLDLTDQDRQFIREKVSADRSDKIVVTHGTDTMQHTGVFLKSVTDKTIVLTGSLSPARFRDSDASFNIGCAVTAAQILPHGVYLAINGRIFDPSDVRKNRSTARFESSSGSS